jgi:hypothetical protein
MQCARDVYSLTSSTLTDVKGCIEECDVDGKRLGYSLESGYSFGNTYRYRHRYTKGAECIMECLFYNSNSVCSRDDFAVRPYAFLIFGNNQYKQAGEDFNVTIKAVDKTNYLKAVETNAKASDIQGVKDYNVTVSDLNISANFYVPTDDEVKQMYEDVFGNVPQNITDARKKVAYCPDKGIFSIINKNAQFKNGEVNLTLSYSETGILSLTVAEKEGSEYAKIDEKDTPDIDRLIKSANLIRDVSDTNKTDLMVFIPYEFKTIGDYNTTTKEDWVYISNDVKKSNATFLIPEMASYIKYDIKALNKQGNVVKNFTATCFPDTSTNAPEKNGLKLNTTFDLLLNADLNTTKDVNISLFTAYNNSAIYTLNKTYALKTGKNKITEWVGPLYFNNGESEVYVYFNINKNYSLPLLPVFITLDDVNTSTTWMNNPGATKIFIGENLDKKIEFRYGRIDMNDVSVVGTNDINTTFKYQYWTKDGWVTNKDHNSSLFGDVNLSKTIVVSDTAHTLNNSKVTISLQKINNGVEPVEIKTAHSLPYSAKLHFAIPSWLWYYPLAKAYQDPSLTNLDCLTHPCMKVTFLPSGKGWAGVGSSSGKYSDKNRTVQTPMKEINASKSTVRKLNW